LNRRWFRALLVMAAWTVFAIFLSSQMYLAYSRGTTPIRYQRIFLVELIYAYIWAALTPFILWLARRFRIDRGRWLRSLLVHLSASLVIGVATRTAKMSVAPSSSLATSNVTSSSMSMKSVPLITRPQPSPSAFGSASCSVCLFLHFLNETRPRQLGHLTSQVEELKP